MTPSQPEVSNSIQSVTAVACNGLTPPPICSPVPHIFRSASCLRSAPNDYVGSVRHSVRLFALEVELVVDAETQQVLGQAGAEIKGLAGARKIYGACSCRASGT